MDTPELFDRFLQSRRRARLAPATIAWYTATLWPLAVRVPGEPTTEEIEGWLDTAPSAASARAWLRAARAMFNWQQKRYGVPSPAATIVPPRPSHALPRVFTNGELRRIIAAATDPRDAAAVAVLLDTGVRIGELHSIRTERIEYDEQQGTAAVTVNGKTGDRRVPLTGEAVRALMRIAPPTGTIWWQTQRWQPRAPRQSVLEPGQPRKQGGQPGNTHAMKHGRFSADAPRPAGRPMAKTTLELRVRGVIARAGVTGLKTGPHTFRHTFATMYLRSGGDIYRLQRLLGHTSIKQTQVYLHLADPEAFEEHSRLSPLTQLRYSQLRMAI